MQVVVNGLLTNYERLGKGSKIVCLHGWGDNGKTFSWLARNFSNSYEILMVDLPGFGGSEAPDAPWGIADYAIFIRSWLEKIGVKDIFAIMGHSNGGTIAIRGLSNHTLNAQKLILIGAAGIHHRHAAKLAALPATNSAKTGHGRHKKAEDKDTIGSGLSMLPELEETFNKVVETDVQAEAKLLSLPTLLLYGVDDKETPIEYGKLLNQAISGSKLVTILDAGHFVHHDRPDEVIGFISEFLNE